MYSWRKTQKCALKKNDLIIKCCNCMIWYFWDNITCSYIWHTLALSYEKDTKDSFFYSSIHDPIYKWNSLKRYNYYSDMYILSACTKSLKNISWNAWKWNFLCFKIGCTIHFHGIHAADALNKSATAFWIS